MAKQTTAPSGKGQRRPHIKLLHRQADEQGARERPDDRAEAAEAELPARAVGAQRRRIEHGADHVDADLDAEHDEAGEERRGQQGGLPRSSRQSRSSRPPAPRARTEAKWRGSDAAAATSTAAARRRCRRPAATRRRAPRSSAAACAAVSSVGVQPDQEEIAHQVEREEEPRQRRDQPQAVAEQIEPD